ncbi:MAG TPA: glycosyltransferase family 2 protein [Campylobacterales bacterium]|nr:glycosyltransferase family 2 protein [Campylobacterales bacterium]
MNISAIVLSKNNEATIQKTLESLKTFLDVVVYDNGSTDNTLEIVKTFSNVNLIQGEFKGFGWTKNEAVKHAKNDWVIIIDSDEVIDQELLETLQNMTFDKRTVYQLNFKAFYKNTQVKYCGWNNQKIKRLYNRTVTSYNQNDVHENIIVDKLKIELLKGNVEHYSYQSIEQFIQKANTYSTLFAKNNAKKKKSSPLKAFFNGWYSFFKTYILKQGFRDGYIGLIIAFSHMATNFYKYIKLYELNKEQNSETKQ